MNPRYALMKAIRDVIVADGVAAAILWLGDNEVLAGSSGVIALGVWRTVRGPLLTWLDARMKIPGR